MARQPTSTGRGTGSPRKRAKGGSKSKARPGKGGAVGRTGSRAFAKKAKKAKKVGRPPRTVLTAAEAARLLRIPVAAVRRHIQQGAPADPRGRLNLIHYAAWLNRQLADGH